MLLPLQIENWLKSIQSGDRLALSKAITLVESHKSEDRLTATQLMKGLSTSHHSLRIGITGPPGVGKSSLIEHLGLHIIEQGHKLAVLSIDPSSGLTLGSILGDKTRMSVLSQSDQAYIRPSPTGDQLGGISKNTREAIRLCEAAGYDYVIVETAGIGQTEYLVSTMVDLTILLHLPGAGDDLQGIKRGVMEWADILAIHKADDPKDPKVLQAIGDLKLAMHFLETKTSGWERKLLTVSSLKKTGIKELWQCILVYQKHIIENGYMLKGRNEQMIKAFRQILQQQIWNAIIQTKDIAKHIGETEKNIYSLNLTPEEAVILTQDYIFATLKK
ncbi:MAG: methylmalonyl Co-A mutase-associated GTPase MeaB [Saprospiraceae bacterium]|nr:methylmalonyl Co-A mutase-associated GTPase MeaB [Saprospiraceae bacterium]